jgi:general secretion pathway protein G
MKQRTTGFTIVELLVVVGIMALLVSIVLPVYQNAMRTTRYNNCMENMRKISVALTLYRSDNGHYPAAPRAEYLQSMDLDAMPLSKAPSWTISPWAAESELDTANKKTLKLAAVTQLVPGMAVKLIPNTEWTIKQLVDT